MKVGDVVHLKSGGPAMTVTLIYAMQTGDSKPKSVRCCWFDAGVPEEEDFPIDALRPASQKPEKKR